MADYAILEAQYSGKGDLHGITTEVWRLEADPLDHPVQAKNIDSETIMDVFPGVLPIYFGSNTTLMSESVTGRLVSGDSQSVIYLDPRGLGAQDPTSDDLMAVFMIERTTAMDQETAQLLQDKIHANQEPLTYWMNFDTDSSGFYIDQVTAIFYLLAIFLAGFGTFKVITSQEKEKDWGNQTSSIEDIDEVVETAMNEEE